MSRMIELSGSRYVAADCIAEITVNPNSQTIAVQMKDGRAHTHQPEYGSSLYRSADKLILEINQALAAQGGT